MHAVQIADSDLLSVQETRKLLKEAKGAAKKLSQLDQEQVDRIVKAISEAGFAHAEELARMAHEETGFGKIQDKIIKNIFAAVTVYDAIKNVKTVGILREDQENKVIELAVPMGVVAGIVPSTNPTSTVIYKAMIALKAGNAICFSPHPGAKRCILEAVKIVREAAMGAGCPEGAISAISIPTLEATNELMKSPDTAIILATGGPGMVKAAYSSGNPALGVGAGNGPAFIHKSCDVEFAVKQIMDSKTFDNGTICASEQSIIVERDLEETVLAHLKKQGAYLMDQEETDRLGKFILRANGTMNPRIVGKSVRDIAKLAGLEKVPEFSRVLVGRADKVGKDVPYAREKLAPILAFYVEQDVDAVLRRSIELLEFEGMGHTFTIHAKDDALIRRFAAAVPASRIVANTPASLGGIGATTHLFPALTLGCGAVGGSATSNNVGPLDLINIKRIGMGYRSLEDIKRKIGTLYEQIGKNMQTMAGEQENIVDIIVEKIMRELI